jgi:hypothetical protein
MKTVLIVSYFAQSFVYGSIHLKESNARQTERW